MKRYWLVNPRWLFGSALYVHWTIPAAALVLLPLSHGPSLLANMMFVCGFVGVVMIHEVGHALAARRQGLQVFAIHLHLLHGSCTYEASGYLRDDVIVAWGGVCAQLLVSACAFTLLAMPFPPLRFFEPLLVPLAYLNLLCALFNLAPVRWMDGGTAWKLIPLARWEWARRRSLAKLDRFKGPWR